MPFWGVGKSNAANQVSNDVSALKLFAALQDKSSTADAFSASMSNASAAARAFAVSADFSADKIAIFEKQQIKTIKTSGKFGASLKTLGSMAKSVGATLLNMGMGMLIGYGISEAIKAIDYEINKFNRLAEAAQDAQAEYEAVQEEIKTVKSELDSISVTIDNLNGKPKLTFVEDAELEHLEAVRAELETQLEVLNAIANIKLSRKESAFIDLVKEYQSDKIIGGSLKLDSNFLGKHSKEDELADRKMAYYDAQYMRDTYRATLASLTSLSPDQQDADAILEANKQLTDYQSIMDENLESIIAEYEKLQTASEGVERSPITEPYFAVVEQLGSWISEQEKAANAFDYYSDAVATIFNKPEFAKAVAQLENLVKLGTLDVETISSNKLFSGLLGAFSQLGASSQQVVDLMYSMYGAASQPIPTVSVDSLADSLKSIGERTTVVNEAMTEQAANGFISYETYKKLIAINADFADSLQLTASGYKINEEAMWGYIEAQGEATKEDALIAMAKLQEELNNTETSIATLQDRYGTLTEAERDDLAALIDHAAGMQTEINQYGALVAEINDATSAYKKWISAKSTKNQDEMFNAGQEMYDVIKEGRKTGKTGTDDFQASVDFMLGENWDEAFKSSGEAYQAAEKKAKRYFGQNDERTGALNFAKDLAKSYGGATFDGKNLVIETGSNLEDMAVAMGMSEDAIRSLFGLMSTYEINFDWVEKLTEGEIKQIKSIEEANIALEAQEKQLANLESKDTSVMTSEQLAENQANIEATKTAIEGLNEQVSVLKESSPEAAVEKPALSPLEQLKVTLSEIQTTITTLNTNGLTIPVSLTEDAVALQSMIAALSTAEALSLDIQAGGTDQALLAVQGIQASLQFIKDNPNLSPTLSASLTEMGKSAIQAIGTAMGWDQETIDLYLNPTDNVTPVVQQIETAGGEAEIDIIGDPEDFNSKMADAESGGESEVVIEGNPEQFETTMAGVESGGDSGYGATVDVDGDTEQFDGKMGAAESGGETGYDATVDIDGETEEFNATIQSAESGGEDGYSADVVVASNAAEIGTQIDAVATKNRTAQIVVEYTEKEVTPETEGYIDNSHINNDGKFVGYSGVLPFAQSGATPPPSTNEELTPPKQEWKDEAPGVWNDTAEKALEVAGSTERVAESTSGILEDTEEVADLWGVINEEESAYWAEYDKRNVQPETPSVPFGDTEITKGTITDMTNSANRLMQVADEAGVESTSLGDAAQAVAEAYAALEETDPIDTTAYAAAAESLTTAVMNYASAYSSLQESLSSIEPVKVEADTTSAENDINALGDKTVTITVKQRMSGPTYASGTKNAKKGLHLVDDAKKGPELIERVSDGTYEIGSSNGPRLTSLNPGDIVHTAAETKKILSRQPKVTIGRAFKDGLSNLVNRGKVLVGKAFATGVSGVGDLSALLATAARSSKKNTSSNKKSTSDGWKKYLEKLFDWIEVKLARLQTVTDNWVLEVERAIGFVNKNKALDSTIAAISTQITTLAEAYHAYMEQAATIASKTKLSSSIVSLIQNGGLDIASYNSDTQSKIKAYQEWWEKAQSVTEEIENLRDEQQKLNNQKLDNIIKQYELLTRSIDTAIDHAQSNIDVKVAQGREVIESDYAPMIQAQQNKLVQLMEGRTIVSAEFNKQVAEGTIAAGSEAWFEYIDQLNSLDDAINDAKIDLEDLNDSIDNIVVTNLGYMLGGLQNTQSTIEQTLELIMAQGRVPTESMYRQLISNGMQQVDVLQQQNEELEKQALGLDSNSEKYQEILGKIRDNQSAIGDIMSSQESWNDAILDLRIDELQRMRDELDKNNQSYQRSLDLQQAIEDLEKAKSQRTVKVLQDGKFVYMRDEEDVASKQRALDQKMHEETLAKFDDAITAIQDSKADSNVWESIGLSPESMVSLFPNTSIEDLIRTVIGTGSTGVDFGLGTAGVVPPIGETNNNNNSAQVTFGEGSVVIQTNDPYEVIRVLSTELGFAFTQKLYR